MDEIELILSKLFSSYLNVEVSEATALVYVDLLSDIPPAELDSVIRQCIAECKFLPTVAEIRERYHNLKHKLGEPTSADAWEEVMREIRRIGSWGAPKLQNPLAVRVVNMMGWLNICQSDKPAVDRAQFMRMYDELVNRQDALERLLPEARQMLERNLEERRKGQEQIGNELRRLGLIDDEQS